MEDYIRKQKMKRVVITGMGIYSCIGRNQEEVKESLFQGKSGIGIAPARKEMGYFSALTGLVERPDLKKLLDRKKRHSLAEQGEYAYMATLEAFRQARIEEKFLLENEVGILYGNDSSAAPVIQAIDIIREKKNTELTSLYREPVPVVHTPSAWLICLSNQDFRTAFCAEEHRK